MGKVISGNLIATGKKFAIVASRFNEFITSKLINGAQDCFLRHGTKAKDLDVIWVPGSFEIPPTAKKLAKIKKYNAIICLGAVIRGETPHFDYISSEAAKGVASVAMDTDLPVIFGIITADTLEQSIERAGTKAGNKGFDAALSAIELSSLYDQISST
ncbi:MAG: 6,7-dimethyl-8-ribityllumazine synthase [Candidatus Aureabacteria bacterium]|nr:6,7-dimethyl-8-ribityllumazine synthase [Candidatus Auribacterota bacterium]MCK5160737.1 6,7-dimethyl-8-ribityllumazine synthase [Candidatus Auribacterota bacterium]MCK5654813.1 6,7-dimethyl-8-ribityllumazine synthase [Candidatus Auribacterota bacterium]